MADSKITALGSIGTGTDPANDQLVIVDVSDVLPTGMATTGTTKRVSLNNLLASSPTATLASATITGDLTAARLIVTGGTIPANGLWLPTTNTLEFAANSLAQYRIAPLGVFSWFDGAGGTRMTLNSTGLGVGASPSYQLHVAKAQASQTAIYVDNQQNNAAASSALSLSAYGGTWNLSVPQSATFVNPLIFKFGSTEMMRLDASGNLLVGKTGSLFSTVGVEASQTGFLSLTNSASTNAATNVSVYSTGAAAFRFYVGLAGTVFATNTVISAISDARLKENVQDIDVGLDAILALKPRKFDWKAGKGKDIKGDRGFIAQEFETVFPNLIDEWKDEAPEGEAPYKSVRQDLIPVLVKAIQELTARVQTLEAK